MNELVLIDKIDKRLQEKREPIVFPLTPTHRKELRTLRDRNIGDLRNRLRTIKSLKLEEFEKKYEKEIQERFSNEKKVCETLNEDWKKRIKEIIKILSMRKCFEKKHNNKFLKLSIDYTTLSELDEKRVKNTKRDFSFNEQEATKDISKEEFDKKFSKAFEEVDKKIDEVNTQYEEAINFGDLEIVKELYYIMKKADKFFERISNIKV